MNVSECTDNDPKCKMQAHNVNKGEEGGGVGRGGEVVGGGGGVERQVRRIDNG